MLGFSDFTCPRHAIEDLFKYLCRWCFFRIRSECPAHEESEKHVLGSVVRVAELEHEVCNKLVQQEVGNNISNVKSVDNHTYLPECHVEVALDIAIQHYILNNYGDCVNVEDN